jgi:hemerythrin
VTDVKLFNGADIPEVALDIMNKTHHEEADLVAGLNALIERQQTGESLETEIDTQLEEWLAHTQAHFSRENDLMIEHGFPPYPIHRSVHDEALELLATRMQEWQETREINSLVQYVQETWPEWYVEHISSLDFVTAQFLSQKI